ncbi:hypothetical protein FBR43_10345 [Sphingomonas baiyangensis]|uniref:DUF2975 domain-containing protein n=1 Tax=Sphingomonas baiyangensis TaxID=2572576 RepID=A0A4U1L3Q1_9SPHN|nr:hypothetical protein FBR43_10345 [Sphingomonas baiyangensis]
MAALWALAAAPQALVPGWTLACSDAGGCRQAADVATLLPEGQRSALAGDPAAATRLAAHVARPAVHLGLATLTLLEEGLLVFLFVAVGRTLRRLGAGGDGGGDGALARALPWLRRGAFAALLWSLAQPLTDSARSILLYSGTPGGAAWYIGIDLTIAGPALLLAIAAYAIAWALEAGVRAERDLADFV